MRKLLTLVLLFVSLSCFADSELYVQIRNEIAPVSQEKGKSFFGSYLYALISGSSVKTELYFSGNAEEIIPTITKLVEEKGSNVLKVIEIDYIPSQDRVDFILSYENCGADTEEGFCDGLYSASAYRFKP